MTRIIRKWVYFTYACGHGCDFELKYEPTMYNMLRTKAIVDHLIEKGMHCHTCITKQKIVKFEEKVTKEYVKEDPLWWARG